MLKKNPGAAQPQTSASHNPGWPIHDGTNVPHHTLSIHKAVGSLHLSVDLSLTTGWTILFGPSGSGKSSLLRAAAGLLGRTGIRFTRNHTVLQDETHFTPQHLREIRWAPQQASLFPHLTVRENLTFAGSTNLDDLVPLFRLGPLLARRPGSLSGGEQQRVNLARAIAAPNCRLLLLDEPFTGLDRTLRDELLPQIRAHLRDRSIPVLSVTHDLDEAFRLQAEVILLREGKVESSGPASTVLAAERARQLAALTAF